MDIGFYLLWVGALVFASTLLGGILGWLLRGVSPCEELGDCGEGLGTTATEALEALELLSELRRAASKMPKETRSPSFVRALELLEARFQLAWMAYSDGRYEEAREIAHSAYQQFCESSKAGIGRTVAW